MREDIRKLVVGLLQLEKHGGIRVLIRRDLYGRNVSVVVALPRDRFNADLRKALQALFLERFQAEPAPSTAVPVVVPEEESSFESQQRMAGVLLKLVMISVPLIILILYMTMRQRPGDAPDRKPEGPDGARAEGTTSAPTTERAPAAPAGAMTLELHPTGTCWVRLTVDGTQVTSRLMQAGEKEVHAIRDSAVLVVGDAGAFAFSLNGRPGRTLGETGESKTIRITRDTYASYLR